MTQGTATAPSQRQERTIILPIDQEEYEKIIHEPAKFRAWIDKHLKLHGELFPEEFEKGYKLHDKSTSEKLGITTRRIELRNHEKWTVRPSFVMPHMSWLHSRGCQSPVLAKVRRALRRTRLCFRKRRKLLVQK